MKIPGFTIRNGRYRALTSVPEETALALRATADTEERILADVIRRTLAAGLRLPAVEADHRAVLLRISTAIGRGNPELARRIVDAERGATDPEGGES